MPFNAESQDWGDFTSLKLSEEFQEHFGVKTYLNWFDGWAINQYKRDYALWEF